MMFKPTEARRTTAAAFTIVVAVGALAGCEKAREAFGLTKQPPDEFEVVTRAPLQLPPDFGLRPPTPGAQRPQEAAVRDDARRVLVEASGAASRSKGPDGLSAGENAILKRAGADDADPQIRQVVSREHSILEVEDRTFFDRMLFWRASGSETTSPVIDADKEAQRLRENAALGAPPTKGATPVITRREKGWLEGIFN
jgi:hypothetical protein